MVTPGYFGRPDRSAEAFDADGFYRTGDAVAFADPGDPNAGLVFRGRLAEDFKLETGTFVRVGAVRTGLLSAIPVLSDAVLAGENRDYVAALAWLNAAEAGRVLGADVAAAATGELIADEGLARLLARALAEHNDAAGSSARDASTGSRAGDHLARLPEDALPAGGQGREHELGAVLAGPLEDQVDRHPSPATEGNGHLLNDLRLRWPTFLHPSAEDSTRPGPGVADLEDQPAVDRQPDEIRQARVRIRVARDEKAHPDDRRSARIALGRRPSPACSSAWSRVASSASRPRATAA